MSQKSFFGFIGLLVLAFILPLIIIFSQKITHTKQNASSPCGTIYSLNCELSEAFDADGRREVFYISNTGLLYHLYQQPNNPTQWSVPISLGTPPGVTLNKFSVVQNDSSQLEVYAIASDQKMYRIIQATPNSSWGTWSSVGSPSGISLAKVYANFNILWQNNADIFANVDVFALGTNGSLYHIWELPNSTSLSSWVSLGNPGNGVTLQTLTETDNGYSTLSAPWGREEVFSLGSDGNLYHIYQGTSNPKTWSTWSSLGKPPNAAKLKMVFAAHNCCTKIDNNITHDINVFVLDINGQQFNISQTAPNASWGTWSEIANPQGVNFINLTGALNSPQNKPQFFSMFGLGSDGNVYEMSQQSSSLNPVLWTTWQSLLAPSGTQLINFATNMYPSIVANNVKIALNIELFAIGNDSNLYHIWQVSPANTSWSSWAKLWTFSQSVSPSPSPVQSPSPSPEVSPSISPSPTPHHSPTPTLSPSPKLSPSPYDSPSPSLSPSPDLSPSPFDSPSPNFSPSPTISSHPTLSPSPSGNQAVLSLIVGLHDLGKGGDNVNSHSLGTLQPLHPIRAVTVTVYDLQNTKVTQAEGQMQFDTNNDATQGLFIGTVSLQGIQNGQYQLAIKSPGYLENRIPQVINITNGIITTVPSIYLVTGDINDDNKLDILDYQALISCFGTQQTNPNYDCAYPITQQSAGADINDDGVVDGIDYNEFLRELSSQSGQ